MRAASAQTVRGLSAPKRGQRLTPITLRRPNATVKAFFVRASSRSRGTVDGRAKVALAAFLARGDLGGVNGSSHRTLGCPLARAGSASDACDTVGGELPHP